MTGRAGGDAAGRAGAPGGPGGSGGPGRRALLLPALALPGVLAARMLRGAPMAGSAPAGSGADKAGGSGTAPGGGRRAGGASGSGAATGRAATGREGAGREVAGREVVGTMRLRPGGVAGVVRLRFEGSGSRLLLDGGSMSLPGAPERLAALPLAGRQVAVAGVSLASGQVLAVLAGWDGVRLRILAVESWEWRGSGPRRLALRLAAVPDDRRVRLLYDATLASPWAGDASQAAATPPGPGAAGPGAASPGAADRARVVVRREAWTDVLAWRDGEALRSEPLRPVLAGTWQARMARTRADVAALLATPREEIGEAELAATGLLDPLGGTAPG